MANGFTKAWKYLMALFSSKVDEYADPKVQIQQAIEDAQRQHQALSQQAAAVIGNQRQLEMKLNRQLGEIEKLQASARQALVLADQARASGDEAKAGQYEQSAQAFATQLVTAEQSVEDLKTLHDQSIQAAGQAKQAVERNSMHAPAEDRRAHEAALAAGAGEDAGAGRRLARQMSELAAPGNTPSLEEVRDKIERRYANAIGSAELAQNSVQGRMLEVQASAVDMAGASRLEQIRASLHGTPVAGEVTAGNTAPTPAPRSRSTPEAARHRLTPPPRLRTRSWPRTPGALRRHREGPQSPGGRRRASSARGGRGRAGRSDTSRRPARTRRRPAAPCGSACRSDGSAARRARTPSADGRAPARRWSSAPAGRRCAAAACGPARSAPPGRARRGSSVHG